MAKSTPPPKHAAPVPKTAHKSEPPPPPAPPPWVPVPGQRIRNRKTGDRSVVHTINGDEKTLAAWDGHEPLTDEVRARAFPWDEWEPAE